MGPRIGWRVAFVAMVAGCGDSGGSSLVVPAGAVLAAVSYDQAYVASLSSAGRLASGAWAGALAVSPVGGGAPQTLDAHATAATFARGTTLYYLGGAVEVSEGAPARPRSYGALAAWRPGWPAAAMLGENVGGMTVSRDGTTVAFIDRGAPSAASPGTVSVWSTRMCAATCPPPIVVAGGVTSATLVVADDGAHVLVGVPRTATADGSIVLVALPAGTVTTLSTSVATNPRSPMMTPDGATVAWLEGANILRSAPSAAPASASLAPIVTAESDSPTVQSAEMVSATSFVARIRIGKADPELYLVAGGAVTPLGITAPARYAVVKETPGGSPASSRWLFYATAEDATSGTEDLLALDLQTPGAAPLALAARTVGNPTFSDDGALVRYMENEDLATGSGDLTVALLPGGAPTLVATGVRLAAFEPGTRTLLYVDGTDATTGVGTLTRFDLGSVAAGKTVAGVINFTASRAEPVLYFTGTNGIFRTDMP